MLSLEHTHNISHAYIKYRCVCERAFVSVKMPGMHECLKF